MFHPEIAAAVARERRAALVKTADRRRALRAISRQRTDPTGRGR